MGGSVMIALLKANDGIAQAGVQPFPHPARVQAPAASPLPLPGAAAAASPTDLRIAQLEQEVEDLYGQLQQTTLAAETRDAEAYQRGQREGASRADTLAQERLQLLTEAVENAQTMWTERLERLEILALEVAQTGLAALFGDQSRYALMVADSVCHHLRQLDHALVIRVRVSPADFGDDAALAMLTARLPAIALISDPALLAGECMIDLQLGRIEAGVAGQWQRLAHFLETMADDATCERSGE